MINRRQPVEFGINMNLLGMIITQQQDLDAVAKLNYFTDSDPCHIYLIGKRPRVIVDPQSFKFYENYFTLTFKIQYGYSFKEINLDCLHFYTNEEVEFVSEFPYNFFMLVGKKTGAKLGGRAALLFQQANKQSDFDTDFLDLEILYVGQSYGEDGKRTPVDRLKSHSTLQNIYLEASNRNIDSEIWLTLVSFEEILIMASHHDNGYTEDESLEFWNNTGAKSFDKIYNEGISEQQRINFTEAALIKYFDPPYNKEFKYTFPSPAHKTYSECYDLDINSIVIELGTYDLVNCSFYSQSVERKPRHFAHFMLPSKKERKSMFEFSV